MNFIVKFQETKQSFAVNMGEAVKIEADHVANKKLAERLADRELTAAEVGTIDANVNAAIADFDGIKEAIIFSGAEIPNGTHSSEYADKITGLKTEYDSNMNEIEIEVDNINATLLEVMELERSYLGEGYIGGDYA